MKSNKVYKFSGTVKLVEERFSTVWVSGMGKDAITKEESQGWFVHLEGWTGAIHFVNKPDCQRGDKMHSEWSFEKP